jgi:predicted PurR-regulated permease PerM
MFVISMTILRLPYALVIGILISLTALIPIVGAFIGCAVGVFLILIDDPVKALVFIVLFIILQQIEGKLIYPKVVGNFVGLPGIWVLVAITVGGSLFGVIGMLVFIPLMSTAYTLLREDVNRRNAIKNHKI